MSGVRILRLRPIVLSALAAAFFANAPPISAQVPIPVQEQVDLFRSLSPAQQQALIRELQNQLPPAQRDAIVTMLTQQQQGQSVSPEGTTTRDVDVASRASSMAGGIEEAEVDRTLGAGDTVVIEFRQRDDENEQPLQAADTDLDEFLERLRNGNPYELDSAGRLNLPGVPAIALAGLNVEQATTRLRAERELRPFILTVTRLPLEPVGTAALEPYGYDLFRDTPSTFAPATDIPVPVDYVVGPGDTLNVQLFGNQNQEYFLEVGRNGTIDFPEIGPLNVSGQSFDDVRQLITDRVTEQMIGVRASTTLGELRSISVFVLGDVVRPGSYTVSSLATMTNALFLSGGVSDIGSLRRIQLKRDGETVTTLDLYDLLLDGDTSGDSRLQPGDVIFVPAIGSTVAVDGEVRRPAIYELNDEETVDELVALAGGLKADANRGAVKLERIVPGRGVAVSDLSLAAAAGGQTTLQDGDVLRVERSLDQLEGTVRLVGNVQRPGLYQWRSGMTVSDLLPSPELVKPLSDINYVLIRREPTPNVEIDVLSVDLESVWQGRSGAADLALEPRDTVYVFHLETGRQQFVEPIIEQLEAQVGPNEPMPVVRVVGQVRAQGQYPLEPGMRVSDLLRAGGGLTDAAYSIEAELTRYHVVDGEFRETELVPVDLNAVLAGDAAADVILSPYDYLNVKEITSWREQASVTLRGEFKFPGVFPIRQGEPLSSVLNRAGGLTEFAFPEGSVFTRVELREREQDQLESLARRIETDLATMSIEDQGSSDALETGQTLISQLRNAQATGRLVIRLEDILAEMGTGGIEADIALRDGDELFVPEMRQEVTVIGEVQYPTSHTYLRGLTREDYIGRSGGVTRRADEKRIYVVRANGEVIADQGARWFRRNIGIDIRPGDTVVVPLQVDRVRPLTLWGSVTQIIYNMAIAAAAVNSF